MRSGDLAASRSGRSGRGSGSARHGGAATGFGPRKRRTNSDAVTGCTNNRNSNTGSATRQSTSGREGTAPPCGSTASGPTRNWSGVRDAGYTYKGRTAGTVASRSGATTAKHTRRASLCSSRSSWTTERTGHTSPRVTRNGSSAPTTTPYARSRYCRGAVWTASVTTRNNKT